MGSSPQSPTELTPIKSLFELLAIAWLILCFFGPLAGIAFLAFKFAFPKTLSVFNYVRVNTTPHLFPIDVLIAWISFGILITPLFLLYFGFIHCEPLQKFIVDVAEFLWKAPFLNRKFWIKDKNS